MSQNNTTPLSPPHTPFGRRSNSHTSTRLTTPWKVAAHNTGDSNQTARQMGDYMSAFPSAQMIMHPFHFGDSHNTFTSLDAPEASVNAHAGPSYSQFYHGTQPDPSQIPLPQTSDANLHHGPTIAQSIGYEPTTKVAGSRQAKPSSHERAASSSKTKGKRRREESSGSDNSDHSDSRPPVKKTTHGGRRQGSGNYGDAELDRLLVLTQNELPVGQHGWKRIHVKYTAWAEKHGHSSRDAKALEAKFKMLVKTKKPTGSGKRPESITRAKAIDKLINEKVGTRNINDSEFDNDDDDGDTSDLDHDKQKSKKYTVTARSDKNEALSSRRPRGNPAMDLAQKLAGSLDPDAQRARDEERTNRSLQSTHIFTLSQQLRDANATIEALRTELATVRDRLHQVERARDRLDSELNFERRMAGLTAQQRGYLVPSHKYDPELIRVKGKVRHDEFFPDGGHSVTWITDGESASDWEENKENIPEPPKLDAPNAPHFTYKPQHMKYKLQRSSRPPTPPSSSPFTGKAPLTDISAA